MAFKDRLSGNMPAVMLVAIGCFSFTTAIFFDQALSGWLRHDRLWWLSVVFSALNLLAAMSNGLALLVWIKRREQANS